MDTAAAGEQRRVMLVADPTRESAGALQYALSHALLENDTLILFHVGNPSAWKNRLGSFFKKPNGNGSGGAAAGLAEIGSGGIGADVDFLDAMKQACGAVMPKLNVVAEKMEMAEGQDKASIILAQSWVLNIDMIIIGQRRKLSNAILLGSKKGFDTAEYLILNSKCGCVAVQKKGQNAGYILSSKTQKNFWLLA
ncbi:uncharacterized protein LOC127249049 [Andrographis paniculata]|uniref:uncharacterized protein LOC127249049 n=1 Tax=Andrographis paniculata TaxID=175694 RepID=UPI0021E78AC7|nr:uncharacterized protein LOC127249049 [Andrographis paniculata]